MKKIIQNFGTDLDWVESFAKNFGGEINSSSKDAEKWRISFHK